LFPIRHRLHPRGAASRGIVANAEGAALGPDCVLVRRTPDGYRCLDRGEAAALQTLLLVKGDPDWLFRQCRCIAAALAEGNLTLAQIYALYIPVDDLDDHDLMRLAAVAPLLKANLDPDEPRDWHGRWTSEGGAEPDKPLPDQPHDRPGPIAGSLAIGEATAGSLLGDLPMGTLSALTRFAARFNAATAALGLLFIPANRRPITGGAIAGRPDLAYSYDADTGVLRLTRDDGAGGRRLLFEGHIGADGMFRDAAGNAVGRALAGGSIVIDPDVLSGIAAGTHAEAETARDRPKLCPAPNEEDITGRSERALRYQEQITGLPRGLEVTLNGARFDGCREADGTMLEAKGPGFATFMATPGVWKEWFTKLDNMKEQMQRQSKAATSRIVEWHFAEKPVADFFRDYARDEFLSNVIAFYTPPEGP
jgi:hypothetical protein